MVSYLVVLGWCSFLAHANHYVAGVVRTHTSLPDPGTLGTSLTTDGKPTSAVPGVSNWWTTGKTTKQFTAIMTTTTANRLTWRTHQDWTELQGNDPYTLELQVDVSTGSAFTMTFGAIGDVWVFAGPAGSTFRYDRQQKADGFSNLGKFVLTASTGASTTITCNACTCGPAAITGCQTGTGNSAKYYFRLYIFYAKRWAGGPEGSLSFTLGADKDGSCSAATAVVPVPVTFETVTASASASGTCSLLTCIEYGTHTKVTATGNTLTMLDTAVDTVIANAWLSKAQRVYSGFQSTFTFQFFNANANGFTFVYQTSSVYAGGAGGDSLGYNFAKSMAMEFSLQNKKIRFMTQYGAINSFNLVSQATLISGSEAFTTFSANRVYTAKVVYDPTDSPTEGFIFLYLKWGTSTWNMIWRLDNSKVQTQIGGSGYLGFTAANRPANPTVGKIVISDWKIYAVEPSGPASTFNTVGWETAVANDVLTQLVQVTTKDGCGRQIGTYDHTESVPFVVSTSFVTSSTTSGTQATRVNGIVTYSVWDTMAGSKNLNIKIAGSHLLGSPFSVAITPGPVSAAGSSWIFNKPAYETAAAIPSSITVLAGEAIEIIATARDRFKNPQPAVASFVFQVQLSETVATLVKIGLSSSYSGYVRSTIAAQGKSCNVIYNNVNLERITSVNVSPAGPDSRKSEIGFPNIIAAGEAFTITLTLNDEFQNRIETQLPSAPSLAIKPVGGVISWINGIMTWGGVTSLYKYDVAVNKLNFSTIEYELSVLVNSVEFNAFRRITVNPAAPSTWKQPQLQVADIAAGAVVIATLQETDKFGNPARTTLDKTQQVSLLLDGSLTTIDCPSTAQQFLNFKGVTCTLVAGQFQVEFTPIKVGNVTVKVETLVSSPITVKAGQWSTLSTVASFPTDFIAGDWADVVVMLKDAYENPIGADAVTYDIIGFNFKIGNNGQQKVIDEQVTSSGGGSFTFRFNVTAAGMHDVTMMFKGSNTVWAERKTTCKPAAPERNNFVFIGLSAPAYVKGKDVTFTVRPRDRFNNNILKATVSSFTLTGVSPDAGIVEESEPLSLITVTFKPDNIAGQTLVFGYTYKSNAFETPENKIKVVEGSDHTSVLKLRAAGFVAYAGAATTQLTVLLRDASENPISDSNAAASLQLVLESVTSKQQSYSSRALWQTSNEFLVDMTLPTVAGNYSAFVLKSSVPSSATFTFIEVVPGKPVAGTSRIVFPKSQYNAGETISGTILLADIYGNVIETMLAETFTCEYSISFKIDGVVDATFSQTSKRYECSKLVETATASLSIVVRGSNAPQVDLVTDDLTVIAGDVISFKVQKLPGNVGVEAGRAGEKYAPSKYRGIGLIFMDKWNNSAVVAEPDFLNGKVTVTTARGTTADVSDIIQESGTLILPFRPTVVDLDQTDVTVTVKTANTDPFVLDESKIISLTLEPSLQFTTANDTDFKRFWTADERPSFSFKPLDQYGNAMLNRLSDFDTPFLKVESSDNKEFICRWIIRESVSCACSQPYETTGNFSLVATWQLKDDQGTIQATNIIFGNNSIFEVTPGAVYAPNTQYVASQNDYFAGDVFGANLTFRDRFENIILREHATFPHMADVSLSLIPGTDADGSYDCVRSATVDTRINVNSYQNITGGVIATTETELRKAATYTVELKIKDQYEKSCERQRVVIVKPAKFSAPDSDVLGDSFGEQGLYALVTSGNLTTIRVTLRDKYQNKVLTSSENKRYVMIGDDAADCENRVDGVPRPYYVYTPPRTDKCGGAATPYAASMAKCQVDCLVSSVCTGFLWNNNSCTQYDNDGVLSCVTKASFEFTADDEFVLSVDLKADKEGVYSLRVKVIEDSLLKDLGLANKCSTLFVRSSYANAFKAGDLVGTYDALYAGVPVIVPLSATDRYDNVVPSIDIWVELLKKEKYEIVSKWLYQGHSYKVELSRTGGSEIAVLGYTTQAHPTQGFLIDKKSSYAFVIPAYPGIYSTRTTLKVSSKCESGCQAAPQEETGVTVKHATCANADDGYDKPYQCHALGTFSCVASRGTCVALAADTTPSSTVPAQSQSTCPVGTVACTGAAAGSCAPEGQCANSVTCPTGYKKCLDGNCVHPKTECNPIQCVGQKGCGNRCVEIAEHCPTTVTCNGMTLCPDGSCTNTTAECPDVFKCYYPFSHKCPDGSCRASAASCPTPVTCIPGMIKCESGACAKKLAECLALEVRCEFKQGQVRCPDGSCRPNLFLCPTPITCPQGLVKCADGSCKADVYQCRHPQIHVPIGSKLCPDGSLVKSFTAKVGGESVVTTAKCPVAVTCPFPTLVKCPDGLCAQTIEDCSALEMHCDRMRCPDGSCRARLEDCPTPLECPDSRPVRCPSGQCAKGPLECLDSTSSLDALTCPADMVRCFSGECVTHRQFCPTHTTCPLGNTRCYDGTCKKDCKTRDSIDIECFSGISCPRGSSGSTCVNHIKDCPISTTCPASMPIKCHDASCVFSLDDCPPMDTSSSLKVACPDGGFYSEFNLCSQMTTCPPELPVKCWDQTCREHPKDCPAVAKCVARSKPYLCPSGICAGSPEDCVTSSARCTLSSPVKCAFSVKAGSVSLAKCGASVQECAMTAVVEPQCPNRASRCLDGSCRALPIDCPELKCPVFLPFMCSNGQCVEDRRECANDQTGCPVARPFKCFWGGCAETAQRCDDFFSLSSAGAKCEKDGHKRCADGSCATKCDVGVNGCASGQILCHHKVCLSPDQCVGQSISGGKEFGGNVCPFQKPYRCGNGMCAESFSKCPIYAMDFAKCNGIRCADGTCQKSGAQCPIVAPCKLGQRKCPDGACIDSARECPWFYPACPVDAEYMCATGLCVPKLSLCPETAEGCPLTMQKCPDGHCVPAGAACPKTNMTCGEKCWDGSCKGAAACPESKCRNAPTSVENDKCDSAVMNHNNCPVASPVRCADGTCAKAPYYYGYVGTDGAACAIHNACQASTPHMCADGSCVEAAQFCRPVICENPAEVYCFVTQSCATSCPVAAVCPAERPVVCKNGLCVSSISNCFDPEAPDRCSVREVQCFDGFCGRDYSECVARTKAVMPDCKAICSDGTCVDAIWKCPTVEKCPRERPLKCPSAVCRKDLSECPMVVEGETPAYGKKVCPRGEAVCGDGACRKSCLASRACSDSRPYFCHRTQACLAISKTESDKTRQACEAADVLRCGEDCNQHVIATTQTLSIAPGTVEVPLALKNGATNARLMLLPGAVTKPMTLALTAASNPGSTVLSTAFKCTKGRGDSDFVLGGIVEAAVDRKIFTSSANQNKDIKFPCTFFAGYRVTLANGDQGFCRGSAEIQNGKLTLTIFKEGTICPALDFEANLLEEPVSRNGEVCAKVKTAKGRVFHLGMTYDANKQPQLVIKGETNVIVNGLASNPELQGCNFTQVQDTVNTTSFSLVKEDSSDRCLDRGDEQEIAPRDICFARRSSGGNWKCLHDDSQRITWDFNASYGQPLSWMKGKIDRCDGAEYAFTYLVLPPPAIPIVTAFNWWAAYGGTFLGVTITVVVIGAAMGYFIYYAWQQRKGYHREKAQLDGLTDKAARVAEYEGGLGVADADGEIEMTANEIIINQQKVASNLNVMAANHVNLEARDNEKIDELAAQRNEIQQKKLALQAEIDKANAGKKVHRTVNEETAAPPPVTSSSAAARQEKPMTKGPPKQKPRKKGPKD